MKKSLRKWKRFSDIISRKMCNDYMIFLGTSDSDSLTQCGENAPLICRFSTKTESSPPMCGHHEWLRSRVVH